MAQHNVSRAQSLLYLPAAGKGKTISAFAPNRENEDFYQEWEVAKISCCHEGYTAHSSVHFTGQG